MLMVHTFPANRSALAQFQNELKWKYQIVYYRVTENILEFVINKTLFMFIPQ